jgi:O-antigen/teichoic acid export membrane protein
MGSYNVASDLATAPTLEVVMPMTRALFPIVARIAHDPAALRKGFLDVFSGTAIICCACSAGMALVARDFVAVALGPQWTQAVPLVQILAFSGGLYGIMQGAVTLLGATGHARLSAVLSVSRMLLTYPALIAAGLLGSVQTIAVARTAVTLVLMPGVFLALVRVLPVTLGDLGRLLWRPVCAAAAMAAAVRLLHPAGLATPWARLLIDVPLGAASFGVAMAALWWLAGRPDGAEAAMLQRTTAGLARRWRRRRRA